MTAKELMERATQAESELNRVDELAANACWRAWKMHVLLEIVDVGRKLVDVKRPDDSLELLCALGELLEKFDA